MTRDYRVLIVEDDAIDRQTYCKMLAQIEPPVFQIEEAGDAAVALTALRARRFDCVLLDFNLPVMSGIDFLTEALVDGELPCAMVLITGQGDAAMAVEAMKRGAQDYLTKDQLSANNLCRVVIDAVAQAELQCGLAGSLRDLSAGILALKEEVAIRQAATVELRAAKEATEQAKRAKTRFVTMVTHELRTPLNGILGCAQLLRLEGDLSPRQSTQVGAMMQACRYLIDMIEDVRAFARIENGPMEMRPETVLVRDLTEACLDCMTPIATERALTLRLVKAHDAPVRIVADPACIRQVLLKLLSNAMKYTDAGGVELHVLAGVAAGALRIEVVDTGRGIAESCRNRLFGDFEPSDTSSSVNGTDLGLVIAARIIKQMGGTIGYMPNPNGVAPNIGSVIWFELPGSDIPYPAQTSNENSARAAAALTVLLVDDIKINRDIIGSFLDAAGHAVVLAESGEQAISLAAQQTFNLILMDVRMPNMDGMEAARQIRLLPGVQGQVPILALTAYTSVDEIAQGREAGMNGHVPKPVNYETLIQAIEGAV